MMRLMRLMFAIFLLGALLAGCDGGCSCEQETSPPPPPAEPEEDVADVIESDLEVIRPDTVDVLSETPGKPAQEQSRESENQSRLRDRTPLRDTRREVVTEPPVPVVPPQPVVKPEPEVVPEAPVPAPPVEVVEAEPEPEPEPAPEPEPEPQIELMEGPYGIMFARIPDGSFIMGSGDEEVGRDLDEGPTIEVSINEFWLGQTEVTLCQWQQVMGHLPFRWQSGNAPPAWTLDEPVRYVSWTEVHQFLDELSRQTGNIFRLPTESEWEYACRGWGETAFWSGEYEADVRETDWLGPYGALHEVKLSDRFNPFGLFDMHGNVSEWVEDDYIDSYSDFPTDGTAYVYRPRLRRRTARGGNFLSSPDSSRSAAREPLEPSTRYSTIGFRIATSNLTETALKD